MDENEFAIPEEALARLRDPEFMRRYVEEGKTLQDIIGYSHETMEKFYRAARGLFEQKRFREAADAFVFLTTVNPCVHNYWVALGMSEQSTEEYEAALLAYSMAMVTDPADPLPYYHAALCTYLLGDRESALTALDRAISVADRAEHEPLRQAAEEAKKRIVPEH